MIFLVVKTRLHESLLRLRLVTSRGPPHFLLASVLQAASPRGISYAGALLIASALLAASNHAWLWFFICIVPQVLQGTTKVVQLFSASGRASLAYRLHMKTA